MQIYASQGDRSSAVRQYERCVQLLQKELGLPPQPETSALYQKIKAGVEFTPAPSKPLSHPPDPSPTTIQPAGLPHPIHRPRPGARGNRRPAPGPGLPPADPARPGRHRQDPPGRPGRRTAGRPVCGWRLFRPLAGLAAGESILPAIAKALRFSYREDAGEPLRQLCDFLRQNQALLVLDNFEQLVNQDNLQIVVELLNAARPSKYWSPPAPA